MKDDPPDTPLWAAGPRTLSVVVGSYEHQLMGDPQVHLRQPFLSLVLCRAAARVDSVDVTLYPVHLPYTEQELLMFGGAKRRGQFGRFIGNLAATFRHAPARALRDSLPQWEPDMRLLFTSLASETVHVRDHVPHYATDYELDIPLERQAHMRNLVACDGRGWFYQITRPDTGCPGPPELTMLPCLADPDNFGTFLHQKYGPDGMEVAGGVPWGLDILARTARVVFETARAGVVP